MKLVGVTAIGSYWSPWFPYTIASIYNVCDQVVVANNGFDFDNFPRTEPLDRATAWIKRLDVNGKIVELRDVTPGRLNHNYPIGTQRAANDRRKQGGEGYWYDLRGLNLTAANEEAVKLGADWILKIDSDEVCYSDVDQLADMLRLNWTGTSVFHQLEFAGDVGPDSCYLADPPPSSPYIDTAQTYRADPETWYIGGGAIVNLREERLESTVFHCAHLREANPWHLTRGEKLEHFYGRVLWRLYTNDYGYMSDEVRAEARAKAETMLARVKTPFSGKPPQACSYQDPLGYIRRISRTVVSEHG